MASFQSPLQNQKDTAGCPFDFGGGCGIRTHVTLLSNGFQDRLVMTASITLRVTEWLEKWLDCRRQANPLRNIRR